VQKSFQLSIQRAKGVFAQNFKLAEEEHSTKNKGEQNNYLLISFDTFKEDATRPINIGFLDCRESLGCMDS